MSDREMRCRLHHAPRVARMRHTSALIVRMAEENPGCGYTRIQGALANLSHKVGRRTIANVLKRNGIEPPPERSRRTKWSTFLKAHWKVLAASDFSTVEFGQRRASTPTICCSLSVLPIAL